MGVTTESRHIGIGTARGEGRRRRWASDELVGEDVQSVAETIEGPVAIGIGGLQARWGRSAAELVVEYVQPVGETVEGPVAVRVTPDEELDATRRSDLRAGHRLRHVRLGWKVRGG